MVNTTSINNPFQSHREGEIKDAITNDALLFPTADTLLHEIRNHLQSQETQSIVFAGEGEPTLRLQTLLSISHQIQREEYYNDIPIRIVTNGLILAGMAHRKNVLEELKVKGIDELSVALMTSCPKQYHELMKPNGMGVGDDTNAHSEVCDLIQDAVHIGLRVECTFVDHGFVDKVLAEKLGDELGAVSFRWRPYFP